MENYKSAFIDLAIKAQVLKFGEFTLKSGRKSPYFFNAGLFFNGRDIALLASCYADALSEADIDFDVLFGPAYKGIPLSAATAVKLADNHQQAVNVTYNRKEAKDHGEGGTLVGAPLDGQRVVIIDDVITAGTAIRESIDLIAQNGGQLAGIIVALNRKEKGKSDVSAIDELAGQYKVPVISIVDIEEVITHLKSAPEMAEVCNQISVYQATYGV